MADTGLTAGQALPLDLPGFAAQAGFSLHPMPSWVLDAATLRILAANAAAREDYGSGETGAEGTTLHGLCPPEDAARLRGLLASVSGPRADGRFRLCRPDGGHAPVHLALRRVVLADRPVILASAQPSAEGGRDAPAALAELQRALEESETRFRLLIDLAPGAILITRMADGMVLYVNQRLAEMFGVTQDQLIGRMTSDFYVDPSDRARLLRAVETGDAASFETRVRRADGSEFWIVAAAQRILHEGEDALLVVFNDITDIKQLGEELRAAREEAERALRAKSRLFAVASHDLRQPLTAFSLFLEALRNQPLDETGQSVLSALAETATGMSRLVDAHLDMARLDAGMVEPRSRLTDIGPLLDTLRAEFGPQALEKSLRLSVRRPDHPLVVRTDPDLLMRILRNLISNALRYTDRGGILLACRPHAAELRVEVWDSGRGIAPEQRNAIFDEFYRGSGDHDSHTRGLGIGLSIARRLTDILGHRIEVASRPGRGSVFRLLLPAAPAGTADRAADPEFRNRGSPLQGRRVLVVDDDPAVRPALEMLLGLWGCTVAAAAGAEEAQILCASGFAPDLILADLQLGGARTGLDLLAELCPVHGAGGIVFTGDTDPGRLRQIDRSGFGVLHKPVSAEGLQAAILALL
jgi:two-component system, sensor histidine kinase